jgi:acyl-CoA synthetase (AMP-forming)/AMP-acid ligase II
MALLQTELLTRLAGTFPDEVAWRNLADGTELTIGRWHRESNRLARGLVERGLTPGERVAIVIKQEEPLEWLVSYLGVHKAGGVAVPLPARAGGGELTRALAHAEPRVVICSEALAWKEATVLTTGSGWADILSDDDSDLPQLIGPDDVADIVYTSGTTGEPKGVAVRHGDLSRGDRVPARWHRLGFLTCSPFSTTSGSLLVCGPMRGGLSGWFLPRFDAARWLAHVAADRPIAAFLVPAMVELIIAAPEFGQADLSSLAAVNVGSAPIASATLRRFGERVDGEVLFGYGMTEFGAVTAVPTGDAGRHLGSVGLPLPGVEVRIVGVDGNDLPADAVGQVAVAASGGTRSYWCDPEASADRWQDGWLLSGDLGRVDADGFLWIEGRLTDTIVRGGHNVMPGEVEAALFEHPAVAEAAVAGVPHGVLGEDVAAWVVLRRSVTTDELRSFLLQRLADYKVPRRITVVGALPRNESGKVVRSELVAGESGGAA